MSSALVEPSTLEHARALAAVMRPADIEELEAFGTTPMKALETGIAWGDITRTILFGQEVGAMFGVCPIIREDGFNIPAEFGSAWLLTGEPVNHNKAAFLRVCKEWMPRLLEFYPAVINFVHIKHLQALRWADWLGFERWPSAPYGIKGELFCPIVMRRSPPCVPQ